MMNDKYTRAFKDFAMQLFDFAGKDFEDSSAGEENFWLTHCTKEKLLAMIPEEQRAIAEHYLEDLYHAALNDMTFYYIHGIHDGARALHHLLMD